MGAACTTRGVYVLARRRQCPGCAWCHNSVGAVRVPRHSDEGVRQWRVGTCPNWRRRGGKTEVAGTTHGIAFNVGHTIFTVCEPIPSPANVLVEAITAMKILRSCKQYNYGCKAMRPRAPRVHRLQAAVHVSTLEARNPTCPVKPATLVGARGNHPHIQPSRNWCYRPDATLDCPSAPP